MKVSVCMAVYGFSPFLMSQLDSILNQTRPINEIVVVEDFSGLDSPREFIHDKINATDIKLKYIQLARNVGPFEAFRHAVSASTGDVLIFSYQDDIWKTRRVEKALEKHVFASVVVVQAQIFYSDQSFKKRLLYQQSPSFNFFILLFKNSIVGATFSIDGNFARSLSKFSFSPMHDWFLVFMSAFFHKKFLYISDVLVFYRRHPNTVTGRTKNSLLTKIKFRFQLIYSFLRFLLNHK